jgi:hypothetical protein
VRSITKIIARRTSESLALAVFLALAVPRLSSAQAPTAWELSHYRIKLIVAVEPGGELSGRCEQELSADLAARAAAVVGGSWRIEVVPPPAELRQQLLHSLAAISTDALPAELLAADKVLLVGVRFASGKYRVEARELDVVTRLWNTTIRGETSQRAAVRSLALDALLRAFAPQARIESTAGNTATLRLRAAALAPRDRRLPAIRPGAALRPVLVKCDARGVLAAGTAEVVPGVYLTPTSTSGASITCRIDAGAESAAIPDYHPHRQRLVLAISPSTDATTLKLVSRGDPSAALEGYDVLDGQELLGRSDRRGFVQVAPGESAVRMLTIRRGEATLASLPLAVGLQPEVTLSVAGGDDSLALEAAIAALEDGLIDLVARRQVLAARIRAAAKAGDMSGGQALLAQLRSTTAADALASKLDQVQQSLSSASADTQPRLKPKLDSLREQLEKYRGDSPADQLEADLKAGPAAP